MFKRFLILLIVVCIPACFSLSAKEKNFVADAYVAAKMYVVLPLSITEGLSKAEIKLFSKQFPGAFLSDDGAFIIMPSHRVAGFRFDFEYLAENSKFELNYGQRFAIRTSVINSDVSDESVEVAFLFEIEGIYYNERSLMNSLPEKHTFAEVYADGTVFMPSDYDEEIILASKEGEGFLIAEWTKEALLKSATMLELAMN